MRKVIAAFHDKKEGKQMQANPTYEPFLERDHLTDKEALDEFQRVKTEDVYALVRLIDLPCGHWKLEISKTEDEKLETLRKPLRQYLKRALLRFGQ